MDIQASIEESSIKLSILVSCEGLSVGRWRVHTKAMSPCILCQVGEFRLLVCPNYLQKSGLLSFQNTNLRLEFTLPLYYINMADMRRGMPISDSHCVVVL